MVPPGATLLVVGGTLIDATAAIRGVCHRRNAVGKGTAFPTLLLGDALIAPVGSADRARPRFGDRYVLRTNVARSDSFGICWIPTVGPEQVRMSAERSRRRGRDGCDVALRSGDVGRLVLLTPCGTLLVVCGMR